MSDQTPVTTALAQELVFLRAQLSALKTRETEVRAALLQVAVPGFGRHLVAAGNATVQIDHKSTLRFDSKLLPPEIRDDARYKRPHMTTTVRVIADGSASVSAGADDRFEVIDRFDA